jgi:hypothetical protein
MGNLFPESLATVEDVFFLTSPFDFSRRSSSFIFDYVHTHTFLTYFRSAKILRLSPGLEQNIGDVFSNKGILVAFDIFPSLEEIELNATTASCTPIRIDEEEVASVLELFQPFVDARQQAGHLVKVHWSTDRVLPGYFCRDTDM